MLVALNAVTMALWSGLMEYNQEMIDHLMQREEAFWTDHVLPRVPPDPQNAADIRLRWPSHVPGAFVETNEETAPTYVELVRTKQQHKAIGARVEELSTILKVAMGDAEALTSDGRVLATWRGQVSSRIDTKRLAKERPDIAAAYRREQLSRVFLRQPVEQTSDEGSNWYTIFTKSPSFTLRDKSTHDIILTYRI